MVTTTKLKSGNVIPRLGLGTWMIGGTKERDPRNDDEGQIKGVQKAIDNGFTFIRTAQNYAGGHCETLLGKAIRPYDRNKLFIAIAVNETFAVDVKSLVRNAEESMKRMGIDYIDLYLLGGLNQKVSIKEMAEGLMYLQKNNMTKDIGVGNYRIEELRLMNKYTGDRIVYNEMHYNLTIREPELIGMLEYCLSNEVVLCAYRPLQFGQLGKPGITLLDEMAKKYKKTQGQIALKWLLSKEGVISVVKALTEKHIRENADIFNWEIEKQDLDKLTKDFPLQMRISDCTPPVKFFTP